MEIDLHHIAAFLEGLEESIISKLIDRAQFGRNLTAYTKGESGFPGEETMSLFDLRLRYQEEMDSLFGRFKVPEERPFTPGLPQPKRTVRTGFPLRITDYDHVNLTAFILDAYPRLLDTLCRDLDDRQYGSCVEHDVIALQAVSRRIHFGAFYVAESKYRDDPGGYAELIAENDNEGLRRKLTRPEVEERVLVRVAEKVSFLQSGVNENVRFRIDPAVITAFYREVIIPLTKDGEVMYLLEREADERVR